MFYLTKQNPQDPSAGVVKASYLNIEGVPINGFRVIEVPDDVTVDESFGTGRLTYDEVLEQKFEGLASRHPAYDIHYFDLVDASDLDLGASSNYMVGDGIYKIEGNGGILELGQVDLLDTFDEFLVYWDVYTIDRTRTGQRTETFYQHPSGGSNDLTVELANGNAQGFVPVEFMTRFQFDDENDAIQLRLTNTTSNPLYIGGLAFLYSRSVA